MHNDGDGEHIAVHDAVRVRKNHTSKRGAFETIGSKPAYTVIKGKVEKNNGAKISCMKCGHGRQNHDEEFRAAARANEGQSQKRDVEF